MMDQENLRKNVHLALKHLDLNQTLVILNETEYNLLQAFLTGAKQFEQSFAKAPTKTKQLLDDLYNQYSKRIKNHRLYFYNIIKKSNLHTPRLDSDGSSLLETTPPSDTAHSLLANEALAELATQMDDITGLRQQIQRTLNGKNLNDSMIFLSPKE